MTQLPANKLAFSGEPSERSERPERSEGRRVRCNAMLGGPQISSDGCNRQHARTRGGHPQPTTNHLPAFSGRGWPDRHYGRA